jgi:arylsulfatase A-like enzyme
MYDDTIFIITSDHGGIKKGHGGKTMAEMQTPFIIAGKNIKKAGEFQESMVQYDVAATMAYIFGLEQPQVWTGRAMKQVFK